VALRREGTPHVLNFKLRERFPLKKTYSFTGDLKVYETCPRQYEYFRYYDFTPSRSAVIFFGLSSPDDRGRPSLVLDGRLDEITDEVIGSSSKQTSGT